MVRVSSPEIGSFSVARTNVSVSSATSALKGLTLNGSAPAPRATPESSPRAVHPTSSPATPSTGGSRLAGLRLSKTVLTDREATETSFLLELLGERARVVEVPLPNGLSQPRLPDRTFVDNGRTYQFAACRVFDDGATPWGGKRRCMRCVYYAASGPCFGDPSEELLPPLDLQAELERWADWRALPSARKAASRLELLQSPARLEHAVRQLTSDHFELIDEPQPSSESGGCGFVPEGLLAELLGGGRAAQRATAVQVRLFAPALGVFKGILAARRGISRIQLPPSMRKLPPSAANAADGRALLLVTRVHPSRTSLQMGKLARGVPPCASFRQRRFSPMIARLLEARGVPPRVIEAYAGGNRRGLRGPHGARAGGDDAGEEEEEGGEEEASPASAATGDVEPVSHPALRAEAWLVGVASPEAGLPAGHVAIPGLDAPRVPLVRGVGPCVFVTRSPCVLPTDGRVVPVVTARPGGMSAEAWAALSERSFGEVVFSNEGRQALPEAISSGDLDGEDRPRLCDLYFVSWDARLVESIAPGGDAPLPDAAPAAKAEPAQPEVAAEESSLRLGDDWLALAQEHMTDAATLREGCAVGKLYRAGERKAKESPRGLDDPDAIACFAAYRQAIDHGKHGAGVELPEHLRKELKL
ncbi:hypothetical protein EMIHUDRAFT_464640 [Emiliania huxleyi CCMP1516]|uniref:RNA-dependent RNA polymerase n=2 Tax=Emiliania huxleyi TaxID=2903 RepID=A0A0D3IRH3_EMIH1|nr:hypothetical protein EMIHUDRAFT_464640 [Emiliania huxleyi CCMP1516]EOD13858.1 hypothetical protein EMIHUDRAFT_464640 [Emiliania huxleyi CCMP1516]|eukprot:XP_005766287.1 hypothetical protein EMIHUDRAFT_464640 [Emiliania huxleyi CCMP1516]